MSRLSRAIEKLQGVDKATLPQDVVSSIDYALMLLQAERDMRDKMVPVEFCLPRGVHRFGPTYYRSSWDNRDHPFRLCQVERWPGYPKELSSDFVQMLHAQGKERVEFEGKLYHLLPCEITVIVDPEPYYRQAYDQVLKALNADFGNETPTEHELNGFIEHLSKTDPYWRVFTCQGMIKVGLNPGIRSRVGDHIEVCTL